MFSSIYYLHKGFGKKSCDALQSVAGNVIKTRSTKPEIHVEVCSKCHPFYTGKQKLVDTGGRVERFNKRFGRK